MPEPNLQILEVAATSLLPLLSEVVFVGGATLGLFVTDAGAAPVRATVDVDVIAEITSHMEYFDFSQRLKVCGFREDDGSAPLNCRWLRGSLILDVMPVESGILLGSVNRWYKDALATARTTTLPSGVSIRAITAPYFLGTKIEAFRGRGEKDFYSSRDLEDFISVIDGCNSVLEEIAASAVDLRTYLAQATEELLAETRFLDHALPGYVLPDDASQQRLPEILRRLQQIAGR